MHRYMKNLSDMKKPEGVDMTNQNNIDFNFGLSDREKNDLESLIVEFQNERDQRNQCKSIESMSELQSQINMINNRLAYLTDILLKMDRRITPMYEAIRLNYQKSEILDQRIRILIKSIHPGELL